tara:strand:+ start:1335 stop:1889 length:555 start_codon:yes stop_codon:yes gene_type:complete
MSEKHPSSKKHDTERKLEKDKRPSVLWADLWKLSPRNTEDFPPITDQSQIPEFNKRLEKAHNDQVRSAWLALQSFILRGLCGGLVASLTLVGSQLFTGPLRENVAYLTTFFLFGLGLQALRMLIEGFGALQGFMGQVVRVQHQKAGYLPGHGWRTYPLLLDSISLIILIVTVAYGLRILFSEAS